MNLLIVMEIAIPVFQIRKPFPFGAIPANAPLVPTDTYLAPGAGNVLQMFGNLKIGPLVKNAVVPGIIG